MIRFAMQVVDSAPTPKTSIFEINVNLVDVNEPITGVTFSSAEINPITGKPYKLENVMENIEPGEQQDFVISFWMFFWLTISLNDPFYSQPTYCFYFMMRCYVH